MLLSHVFVVDLRDQFVCLAWRKTPQDFMVVKMNDIIVTGVHPAGNGSGEAPTESFTLKFAKVDFEYKPQKSDGSLDAGLHFKYDIKANKEG